MADLRRCIGWARFGIEPHDAPVDDFPNQPSQKDGLGRMCKAHWNVYTAGLARDAKARRAATEAEASQVSESEPVPEPTPTRPRRATPSAPALGDAG